MDGTQLREPYPLHAVFVVSVAMLMTSWYGHGGPWPAQCITEAALTSEKGPVVSFCIKGETIQASGKLGKSHLLRGTLMARKIT